MSTLRSTDKEDMGRKNDGGNEENREKVSQLRRMYGHNRSSSLTGEVKKRKVHDTSIEKVDQEGQVYKMRESPECFLVEESLDMVKKLVKNLQSYIEQNTKREIKETTTKLTRQMDALDRDSIKQWLKKLRYEPAEKMVFDADTQTDRRSNTSTREMGTQTIGDEVVYLESEVETYEDWEMIGDATWEEESFRNTEIKKGSPLNAKVGTVMVVIVDPSDEPMEKGIQGKFRERFPELGEINDEIGVVEQECKIRIKDQVEKRNRKIIKLLYDNTDRGLFQRIKDLRQETDGVEWIAIHKMRNMDTTKFRKMIESVFHSSGTKVIIYTPESEIEATKGQPKRKTYALIVESKEKTFTETLKGVKETLKKEKIGEGIRGIKSTRNGKVLITIEKDGDAINKISEAINRSGEETKCKRMGDDDTEIIHVRGMDALVKEEEIREAIADALGGEEHGLEMGKLRPMKGEMKAITIKLDKKGAETLLRKRQLKIGFISCELDKRIEVLKCFKCWGYGHTNKDCKGADRTKLCYKCGETDHGVKDCPNEESCPMCKAKGHKAGSGKCRIFKEALTIARRATRKRNV
ncbi:uncharacterized protein PF3D7_1120000-like [Onthophagus taurus]|uniref:uncharacterized protein PF3D7_1120000-like n=1 Tax=Onthophagus taurus TaxID=166361 RepID=UPI0039BE15F6